MTLKDKFFQIGLSPEHLSHSSLVCFYALVDARHVPFKRLAELFDEFVDPMDYECKKSIREYLLIDLRKRYNKRGRIPQKKTKMCNEVKKHYF